MSWPRSAILSAVLLTMTAAPALSWDISIEGPDVFGNHKAVGGAHNGRDTLVIQCDNEDQLHLAYLIPIKEFEETPTLPAIFLLQIDSGDPRRLDATLRGWNKKNAGIVISGRTKELAETILSLGSAKSRVNVGYDVNGARDSATFSARGSTAVVRKFDTTCKLSGITD